MNISSTSTPARILIGPSCSQVPIVSLHAWISKVQAPSESGRTVRRHPQELIGDVAHPDRVALRAPGIGQHDLGAELVVPLAEHGRGDLEVLVVGRLRRVPSEVDDGSDVEDGDSADHAPHTRESAGSDANAKDDVSRVTSRVRDLRSIQGILG